MKMVFAYVRHEAFEPIRTELLALGFPSLSISEVKGSGRQKGITERYRGAELTNYLRPKVKLECVVASGDVQAIGLTIAFMFVFSMSFVTFFVIKKTIGLRVSEEEEDAGLDISEHGMYGYPEQFIPAPELVGYTPGEVPAQGRAGEPVATKKEVPA